MSVQKHIETKLEEAFQPTWLAVDNESHRHNVPPGSESHFRATIVSEQFDDLPLLERHRLANRILAEELAGPVHALALHTYTPQEWASRQAAPSSPPCLGGDAR